MTRLERPAERWTGFVLVAVSAASFGTLGIFATYAYQGGANIVTVGAGRFALAAALLWLLLLMGKANGSRPQGGPAPTGPIAPRQPADSTGPIAPHQPSDSMVPSGRGGLPAILWLQLAAMGVFGYALMSALFFVSVARVGASLSALLLYSYPALVAAASHLTGRERLNRLRLVLLGLTAAGLVLVLGTSFGRADPLGLAAGALSSVVYSTYIMVGDRLLRRAPPLLATAMVSTGALASYLAVGFAQGTLDWSLTGGGWLALVGLGVVATVIAVWTFFEGIVRIGPAQASLVSTLEPVVTVALGFWLQGERLSPTQWWGGALILASVALLALSRSEAAPGSATKGEWLHVS